METIDFEKKIRPDQKNSKGRVIQNERTYFDFIVSGQSVKIKLKADNLDLISPLGWGDEKYESEIIKEFTGQKKPETPSGRHPTNRIQEGGLFRKVSKDNAELKQLATIE